MKQLLQSLKNGELSIVESPVPARPEGYVLVANRASLISSGTEGSIVRAAQASLVGKARQRPDKVRQVLDNVKKEGVVATVAKVREKLDQPKALGYSCAGVVLDSDAGGLETGTPVACGGADFAVHAEVVCVPKNLVVPIPDGVSFDQASFVTVGAIALQGVRRAGVGLGDRVLVIGLGLIGQLTWQLLHDAGCVVVGTDVRSDVVDTARAMGLERAYVRGRDDVEAACMDVSAGHGVDAVIITAATKSRDPLELAGTVCRERGRVSVVGLVPMDVPREPFYMKELDLLVSRSYGPGRYDPEYEQKGHDYPYAHVRWTEQRNMSSFLESVGKGAVRADELITHRFPLDRAEDAYALVSGKVSEPHLGIVLQYPERPDTSSRVVLGEAAVPKREGVLRIGFAGAGSFARSYLLPHLKGREGVALVGVSTSKGYTATDAAKKFGFAEARTDTEALVRDDSVDAVFIATRHDLHAPLTQAALEAGKHVFVEKPLAVKPEQLGPVVHAASRAGRILQVGFNRRFSPLAVKLRETLQGANGPVQVTYRVNAGALPADHWLIDPEAGGGRIVGEGCHFIDLIQFLTGERPARVQASSLGDDATGVTSVLLELDGGSVGVLVYQANATSRVPKERVEAFSNGRGGILDDWKNVELLEGRKRTVSKARGQAKGYAEEVAAFLEAARTGRPAISLESQALTTAATFAVLESIRSRQPVDVSVPGPDES